MPPVDLRFVPDPVVNLDGPPRAGLPRGVAARFHYSAKGDGSDMAVIDIPSSADPFAAMNKLHETLYPGRKFDREPPAAAPATDAEPKSAEQTAHLNAVGTSGAAAPRSTSERAGRVPYSTSVTTSEVDLFASPPPAPSRPAPPVDRPVPRPSQSVEQSRGGVRDTSMDAYRALQASGKLSEVQRKVLGAWDRDARALYTRQELVRETGVTINSVCGRVNELLAEPFNVLVEVGKKVCGVTGNNVNALALACAQPEEEPK